MNLSLENFANVRFSNITKILYDEREMFSVKIILKLLFKEKCR